MHSIPAMINRIAFFISFLLDFGSRNGNDFSLNSTDFDSLTGPGRKKPDERDGVAAATGLGDSRGRVVRSAIVIPTSRDHCPPQTWSCPCKDCNLRKIDPSASQQKTAWSFRKEERSPGQRAGRPVHQGNAHLHGFLFQVTEARRRPGWAKWAATVGKSFAGRRERVSELDAIHLRAFKPLTNSPPPLVGSWMITPTGLSPYFFQRKA